MKPVPAAAAEVGRLHAEGTAQLVRDRRGLLECARMPQRDVLPLGAPPGLRPVLPLHAQPEVLRAQSQRRFVKLAPERLVRAPQAVLDVAAVARLGRPLPGRHRQQGGGADPFRHGRQPGICTETAPRIRPQKLPPLGARPFAPRLDRHRVQMHVPAQPQQVRVARNQRRAKPPLHQVAAPAVPEVEVDRVPRQHAAHERAQIPVRRLHQHVPVVAHPAVEEHPHAEILGALRHARRQPLPVTLIHEYRLPRVPPERHMVDRTLELDSQFPRHAGHITPNPAVRQLLFSGLTPIPRNR